MSSEEEEEEEEVGSQGEEEEEFCWIWRAKLTILVALRLIFLLADLVHGHAVTYDLRTQEHHQVTLALTRRSRLE